MFSRHLQKRDNNARDEDGPVPGTESEHEIPFNLDNLRKHLAQIALARRVLPEDVAARQKLLEESVYDVAVERLKHQAELFTELGLGNTGLREAVLQAWMWDWHQKLKTRLETEIKAIIEHESNPELDSKSERLRLSFL
jgi:DNA-directed RNA polymerase